MKDLVSNMANVLDLDMPEYVINEDKSKQTHLMINKKASVKVEDDSKNDQGHETVINPFLPFDDELEHQFYTVLPDYKRFYDAL